jgi:hypothetical protein
MSALTEVNEQLARKASVAMATTAADLEQKQRVEAQEENKAWDKSERTVSVSFTFAFRLERQACMSRHIFMLYMLTQSHTPLTPRATLPARLPARLPVHLPPPQANQRRASKMLDAEQARRISEAQAEDASAASERASNQAAAVAAMEEERGERRSLRLLYDFSTLH